MEKLRQTITYCLLCKTIPEYSKTDQTLYSCSIGFSPQLGLIRVYPLPPTGMVKWGIYKIEVEKNKRDSRAESWKLTSYTRKDNWRDIEKDCIKVGTGKPDKILPSLMEYVYPSISQLNKDRKSIGLINTDDAYTLKWESNKRFINTKQIGMFEDVEIADWASFTKETKEKESRVIFVDGDGKHNLQFNEWQVYECGRKFGYDGQAFRFLLDEKSKGKKGQYLLIGNMHSYRNNWIGLGFFKLPKQMGLTF